MRVALCTFSLLGAFATSALANTYNVTSTADDTGVGSCSSGGACSLRQAINTINASPNPPDVINVPAGDYVLGTGGGQGRLEITENMTIKGAGSGTGAGTTTVDGNGHQVFIVDGSDPTSVTLQGMNIQGNTNSDAPTIDFVGSNTATLTLSHDAVINNQTDDVDGGGIYFADSGNPGGVDISDSTIANNTATCCVNGAGIAFENSGAGTLTIDGTTFSGNNAGSQDGGAVYFDGATATITNSTISGNTAAQGGGLNLVGGSTTLTNDTIANNSLSPAGTASGAGIFGASTVAATNTIVSGNTGGASGMNDCDAHVSSSDHSLENGSDCGFDRSGDPKLGALANNGGPTQTMALGAGSAATDAGTAVASVTTDQRGGPRPQPPGGAYDIGAYEVGAVIDMGIAKSASPSPATAGKTLTYTLTATNHGPTADPGYAVTVTDTLPSGLSFQSASASQGSCSNASGKVTCNLGTIASGASATVTINVTPNSAGSLTNTASVSSSASDPNSANDTASVTTQVQAAAVTASGSQPVVSTGGVTDITFTSALLHGSVNPEGASTTYFFEYGQTTTDPNTPSRSAGSGMKSVSVSQRLTGLRPGTLYHYRLVATNSHGTSRGADRTFRTPRRPSLHVQPARVRTGGRVRVFGNAGGCPVGDRVTLLSRGFSSSHEFAGVPAVYATVARGGSYSTRARAVRRVGRYVLTGRCGGGNLGVSAHLTVFAPPAPPRFTG